MTRIVLVTGGRSYKDASRVNAVLDRVHAKAPITLLVHGDCPVGHGGADKLADAWARHRGVPVDPVKVDHALDGPWPGAGPQRNSRMMAKHAYAGCVAFPGERGTADMVRKAKAAGVPVVEVGGGDE